MSSPYRGLAQIFILQLMVLLIELQRHKSFTSRSRGQRAAAQGRLIIRVWKQYQQWKQRKTEQACVHGGGGHRFPSPSQTRTWPPLSKEREVLAKCEKQRKLFLCFLCFCASSNLAGPRSWVRNNAWEQCSANSHRLPHAHSGPPTAPPPRPLQKNEDFLESKRSTGQVDALGQSGANFVDC